MDNDMTRGMASENTGAQTVTVLGRNLIAKLIAGEVMQITRVQFGSGTVGEGEDIRYMTDLVEPVVTGTSDIPTVEGGVAKILCEYNNTLNGGLAQGFWISEFGIYAEDPDEGEVLIFYATLGEYPQWVSAYATNRVDVHRFPVTIAIGDDRGIEITYNTALWMTEEDVHRCFMTHLLPIATKAADERIAIHNASEEAHPYIQNMITKMAGRLSLLELLVNYGGDGENQFLVTFSPEDVWNSIFDGIWNRDAQRLEW